MQKFYFCLALCLLLVSTMARAQKKYGTGLGIYVPHVAAGSINLDGHATEAAWANADSIDLTKKWDGSYSNPPHPSPDVTVFSKLLWTEDTLFVYTEMDGFEPFYWGDSANHPYNGDQFLIGVDDTHSDDTAKDEGFAGWPENAPDKGATTYKVTKDAITLNWGQLGFSPTDTGWVKGTVWVDSVNFKWGVEMGIRLPHAVNGGKIGFNAGGAPADSQYAHVNNGDGTYAYFSWQAVQYPGGDVMHNSASFGTLILTDSTLYGTRVNEDVPFVAPGTLNLDGKADEAAWANADSINLTDNWDGSAIHQSTVIDTAWAKLLWTTDTLYVYTTTKVDSQRRLYWGPANQPNKGDQILIGVDDTHKGDTSVDNTFSGWPQNAPNHGPTTYKIGKNITLNWGFASAPNPVTSGWARGTVLTDSVNNRWSVEAAIYLPHAVANGKVGFNIGGGTADSAKADVVTWYSWQSVQYPGGDVMSNAHSFATLSFISGATGVFETPLSGRIPQSYTLQQNYPNPFNPETKIQYALPRNSFVNLTVYNILGQSVATLIDGQRSAGEYSISWNANNFPSGMYFYVLRADNQIIATKKMMLVK